MCYVELPDGTQRTLKNLGWLLRNWKLIQKIGFTFDPSNVGHSDGILVAYMTDGSKYFSDFADITVLFNWLNRPVFKSVGFVLAFGNDALKARRELIVGDHVWKELCRKDYKAFHAWLAE